MQPLAREVAELFERALDLSRRGMLVETIAVYGRLLEHEPDNAAAHCNRGVALLEAGDLEGARAHFRSACALAPRVGRYQRYRVETRAEPISPADCDRLQALAEQLEGGASDDRINLHFALGAAWADRADHRRSFEHFRSGNALKRTTVEYDEAELLDGFARLPVIFSRSLIAALSGHGHSSELPIFVFGMPRSGTTLVEQLLAAHSQVTAAGELRAFEGALHGFAPPLADPHDVATFAAALTAELRALGTRYLAAVTPLASGARRLTDKNPLNFRFLGAIHLALPKAKLIHVRRNPTDTCWSCYTSLFTEGLPFAYDLGELGRYHRAYQALMAYWRTALPPGTILEVEYEALVDDFAAQARRLLEHCELDWEEECLRFHAVHRPIRTASATAVRQPLYRSAIGRARPYRPYLGALDEALLAKCSG